MEKMLSIGQVAEHTGLSAPTLRYYESLGLVQSVARNETGARLYTPDDVAWLHVVRDLRATGMPIARMRAFVQVCPGGLDSIGEAIVLLQTHLAELETRSQELRDYMARAQEKLAVLKHFAGATDETDFQNRQNVARQTLCRSNSEKGNNE